MLTLQADGGMSQQMLADFAAGFAAHLGMDPNSPQVRSLR